MHPPDAAPPTPDDRDVLDRAVEAFVRGFSFTRSFTHPYLPERIDGVWVMRDAPRRRGDYRIEEWVALGAAPEHVDRLTRELSRGRFCISAILPTDMPLAPCKSAYRALGFRLGTSEAVMVHDLRDLPPVAGERPDGVAIERVTDQAAADQLARSAGARQVLPEHLAPGSALRQYVARDTAGGQFVGWVRSIAVGDATWCSNMFVRPEHRRRGIARAMLARLLRDDRASGSALAALTASNAGALLYPAVGYRQIGTLLLFHPRRA